MYTPRNMDLMGLPYTRADGGSLNYRTSFTITSPNGIVTSGGPSQSGRPISLEVDFCQ
ncbi:MAG: hypothetical protein ACPH57_05185 [Flavobacteriaceae bacterium]